MYRNLIYLFTVILVLSIVVIAGANEGLIGEYYHGGAGDAWDDLVMVRLDPTVDFGWGNGSPEPGVVNVDNFKVRWTGEVEIPATGTWTVQVNGFSVPGNGQPGTTTQPYALVVSGVLAPSCSVPAAPSGLVATAVGANRIDRDHHDPAHGCGPRAPGAEDRDSGEQRERRERSHRRYSRNSAEKRASSRRLRSDGTVSITPHWRKPASIDARR